MPRSFILCGISWDQFDVMFPDQAKRDEMIAVVKRGLDQTAQTFDEAGLEYEFFNCSPDEDMSRWEAKITEKKWDGIAVGAGIRLNYPNMVTDLVNTVIAKAPHSKVFFNTTPKDTFEAAKRIFPDI